LNTGENSAGFETTGVSTARGELESASTFVPRIPAQKSAAAANVTLRSSPIRWKLWRRALNRGASTPLAGASVVFRRAGKVFIRGLSATRVLLLLLRFRLLLPDFPDVRDHIIDLSLVEACSKRGHVLFALINLEVEIGIGLLLDFG
jgi:hypothetical protein